MVGVPAKDTNEPLDPDHVTVLPEALKVAVFDAGNCIIPDMFRACPLVINETEVPEAVQATAVALAQVQAS